MSEPARSPLTSSRSGLLRLLPILAFLRPYRWRVTSALVALVFTALIMLSLGQGLRLMVDAGFGGADSEAAFNRAIGVFLVLVLALAAGTFTRFYLVSWIGERVIADLRKAVFNHLIELHPGFFETATSGEIQSRITADTTLLQTVIGSSVSMALRNLLMFIGGLVWMFISNPKLTSIVLVSVPVVVVPIIVFGRRVRKLSRSSQDKVADVGSYVGEALHNIKILQAFNHQQEDVHRFGTFAESAFDVSVKRITQRAWLSTLVIVLVLGAIGGMIWVGGHDVLAGRISAGELVAFVFYAMMVAGSVGMISEVLGDVQRAAGATERLMELLAAKSNIAAPEEPVRLEAPLVGNVSLEDVVFHYPTRPEKPALNHLRLFIPAGTSMALVGSSGAGKSTLFDLLLRFYDPQQGAICFDGYDIRNLTPADLRRHLGLVPQQPVLFTGSVADNIRYGRPEASDTEVEEAARTAYADEFIRHLPQGYQSQVGEGGVRLSGGQRQRIAIARAILRNPEILLLDEATSALDAESEFQVQKALEQVMKGRTTLVIAHRLATVINVDCIAVLDQGRVVAKGTHHELLVSSPLYARWAKLQFDEASRSVTASQVVTEGQE